ncbi:MAG: rhomboid family intramembrane serine protease [Robiginitomaculum sp.]
MKKYDPNITHKEPIFNIEEKTPIYLIAILIGMHALMIFVPSVGNYLINAFSLAAQKGTVFIPHRTIGNIPTLLTHVLVHAGWQHVLMNSAFIGIFGILAMRGVRNKNTLIWGRLNRAGIVFLGLFIAGAVAGGLGQWLLWMITKPEFSSAVGASTGSAALFAAAGWVIGGRARMYSFGIFLVAMDAFALVTGGMMGNPAWAGHLGGYLAGVALVPLLLKPNCVSMRFFG